MRRTWTPQMGTLRWMRLRIMIGEEADELDQRMMMMPDQAKLREGEEEESQEEMSMVRFMVVWGGLEED